MRHWPSAAIPGHNIEDAGDGFFLPQARPHQARRRPVAIADDRDCPKVLAHVAGRRPGRADAELALVTEVGWACGVERELSNLSVVAQLQRQARWRGRRDKLGLARLPPTTVELQTGLGTRQLGRLVRAIGALRRKKPLETRLD